jgi:PhnB protein
MTKINPYLSFDGNCREVMNFYQGCIGGKLVIQAVNESPMAGKMPEKYNDAVMHSSLVKDDLIIMASDMHRGELVAGNNIQLCVNCGSEEEVNQFFNRLSAGGTVIEAPAKMFWGGIFGALTDKYGMHWIFNYEE